MGFDPLTIAFSLSVHMESDWHVGTGGGRQAAVDNRIDRDQDGLPFLPGSTIRGVWRAAAQRLALGLNDGDEAGPWSNIVAALFGGTGSLAGHTPSGEPPQRGALVVGAARIPPVLRNGLVGGPGAPGRARLRQALTFVTPQLAIESSSGRARPGHPRTIEMARQGAVLVGQGQVAFPDGDEDAARAMLAMLVASTQLVDRLGGKRRRGTGRCSWTITIDPVDALAEAPIQTVDQAVAYLTETSVAPVLKPCSKGQGVPRSEERVGGDGLVDPWQTVAIDLTLLSPLVIAESEHGPTVTSRDSIPGTYLLPHVSRALKGAETDIGQAIATGSIRVSVAYPVIDDQRSLPIPLAWARVVDDGIGPDGQGRIINRARETDRHPLNAIESGYVAPHLPEASTQAPHLLPHVPRVMRTHNTVDSRGQPQPHAVGDVFAYEALAPGQRFRALVRVRDSIAGLLPEGWQSRVATGILRLGRATKAGYGEVALTQVEPGDTAERQAAPELSQRFTVYFAADTQLRPPLLGAGSTRAAVVEAIEAAIGQPLVPAESSDSQNGAHDDSRPLLADLRTRRIDSWATSWNLPRPSLIAIQAGSFVTCQTASGEAIAVDQLARLEQSGVGERRAEGYGEVLVNSPLLLAPCTGWVSPSTPNPESAMPAIDAESVAADDPLRAFAEQIELASWRAAIEDAAVTFANDGTRRKKGLGWSTAGNGGTPPMGQLGALQAVMGGFDEDRQLRRLFDWLASVERTESRRAQWGDGLTRLRQLLKRQDGKVWRLLFPDPTQSAEPAPLLRAPDALRAALWQEAVRAVLFASMRAHKRALDAATKGERAA